jgi:hypothetical protein
MCLISNDAANNHVKMLYYNLKGRRRISNRLNTNIT